MATEMLGTPKARNLVMTFWNSDDSGWEVTNEYKNEKSLLGAVHDLDLVGKVAAIKRSGQVYLINRTKLEDAAIETLEALKDADATRKISES